MKADPELSMTRGLLTVGILFDGIMLVGTAGGGSIDRAMTGLVVFILILLSIVLGVLWERYQ